MKRLATVVCAVILTVLMVSNSVFAQPGFGKGVKAGLNIANLSGSDIEGTDSKTGLAFGVFVDVPFGDMFSIQPEALYSFQGAKDKFDVQGTTVDVTFKLNYIQIPVLLKLNVPVEGSAVKPAVFAGPALGIKTTSKRKIEAGGQSQEDDLDDVKSTDFSLVFGAGIGFGAGSMTIGFDFRYWLGLSSIDDSAANADMKNKVIQFIASLGL